MIIYIIMGIILVGVLASYGTIKLIESITIDSEVKVDKKW